MCRTIEWIASALLDLSLLLLWRNLTLSEQIEGKLTISKSTRTTLQIKQMQANLLASFSKVDLLLTLMKEWMRLTLICFFARAS